MKAYQICLYFFIINTVLAMLNALQPFTIMSGGTDFFFAVDNQTINAAESFAGMDIGGLTDIDFLAIMMALVQIFLNATILLPVMLANLGLPALLIPCVTLPAWYCYLAGLVQLSTGRILPLFE